MENRKAWIALLIICVIWGTTYLFLKIGVSEMPPFQFSGIRQVIAGLLLFTGIALFRKMQWPGWKQILLQSGAGFLMITIGNGLVAYGEVNIPSSMAAVICASMPVWVSIINLLAPGSIRLTWVGYFSLFLGLGGLFWLFSDSIAGFGDTKYLWGAILTLVATFGWIGGSYIIKRGASLSDPFLNTSLQMFSGGIGLILISFITSEHHTFDLSFNGWFALLYLIVFGSIIAMLAYSYALKHLPLPIVSVYAYINPVVAIILGWVILDEHLTWNMLAACVLIVLSVVLLNQPISKQRSDTSN